MYHRKSRKFRRRSNGRGHLPHGGDRGHIRLRSNSFSNSNEQIRNSFRNIQSAEKLLEKYVLCIISGLKLRSFKLDICFI